MFHLHPVALYTSLHVRHLRRRPATAPAHNSEETTWKELNVQTCGPRGTLLGTSLPSLASIRSLSAYPERVKYCLDLCHVHSASHDLSTESGRGRFEVDVERYLGREHVVLVHVSECGVVGGSGGDVHRPFGQ